MKPHSIVGIDARELVSGTEAAGIGTYVRELVGGLQEATPGSYRLFTHRPLPAPFTAHQILIGGPRWLWHVRVAWYCVRQAIPVYHSPHSLIVPLLLGARCVLSIHDLTAVLFPHEHTRKVRWISRLLLRITVRRVGALIVPSESTKTDLLAVTGLETDAHLFVTPYAISGPALSWEPHRDDPYILFVGTLEPRKNLTSLIEAFAVLRTAHQRPERLVVVGKRGWGAQQKALQDLIRQCDIEDAVHFTGYVSAEEKWQWYAGASVMVYPSLYEGFGYPVLEAMHVGVPVITSSVSSLPEVAGDAAVLVDPTDQDGLVRALLSILSDPSHAQELSVAGVARAQRFRRDVFVNETRKVYDYV